LSSHLLSSKNCRGIWFSELTENARGDRFGSGVGSVSFPPADTKANRRREIKRPAAALE
jgi:hypothetical protein